MKRSTLNAIMTGVIIVLVIAISVASVKLLVRGHVEPEEEKTEEYGEIEDTAEEIYSEEPTEESSQEVVEVVNRVRITGDNINVRSGPGTEYDRLGSAYFGYTFELVKETENDWIKIIYDGKEAYVYANYAEIVPMVLGEDGEYTEYVGSDVPFNKPETSEDESEDEVLEQNEETDNVEENEGTEE